MIRLVVGYAEELDKLRLSLNRVSDHLHVLVVFSLLAIVTTWPLAVQVIDVNTAHVILGNDGDPFIEIWDAWYGRRMLSGEADFYFTDLLFHPDGLSLAYHHFGLPHMFIFGTLQTVLPTVNAYFLTHLLIVILNALASYIFLSAQFPSKWIAMVGAIIFSFSPYFFPHIRHPDLTFLAPIPLALYALDRGINEQRWRWMVAAGVFAGFTAYIGMYILVCLFVTMGVYTVYLASSRWRQTRFWIFVALTLVVAATIGIPRLYPMIADLSLLGEALDKGASVTNSTDLLVFLVNARHPVTPVVFQTLFGSVQPRVPPDGYLGFAPLLLTVIGFARGSSRRAMIPWLVIGIIFALLRLGSVLKIGGHVFPGLVLPKHYLDVIVPWLTKAFWDRAFFQIGILLPLAILSCFGLQTLLFNAPRRRRVLLSILVTTFVAFEYYQPPIAPDPRYKPQYDWIDWLSAEDNQTGIRLINLPMGRYRSKLYLYHQTLHGYPLAEGLASRTPARAYDYIEQNYLLNTWHTQQSVNCLTAYKDKFIAARDQLLADGFTHVIHHLDHDPKRLLERDFTDSSPSYRDQYVNIYRVEDLQLECTSDALLHLGGQAYLPALSQSAAIIPPGETAILSLHPEPDQAGPLSEYTDAIKNIQEGWLLLRKDDLSGSIAPIAGDSPLDPALALEANRVILFAFDPRSAEDSAIKAYRSWLLSRFKSCERVVETEAIVVEYFLRQDVVCQLVAADDYFQVDYDNGIKLDNLVLTFEEDLLNLYVLWRNLPVETNSFSVQLFDENDSRIFGQDFVIDRDSVNHYQVDLSALKPGTYAAKLIVYNFETLASVSGTVRGSEAPFDRALELAQIAVSG